MKRIVNRLLGFTGYTLTKTQQASQWPTDFEEWHQNLITKALPYTMTSRERLFGLVEAVKYITHHNIPGSIVECGVWKGGSMLAVAETLLQLKDQSRRFYLYDTFEGMSAPTENDVAHNDTPAQRLLEQDIDKESNLVWAYSALEEVKKNMALSCYPQQQILYVKGKVEDTIPEVIPESIALLRLDTDWYESTRHELTHLFPRLQPGGVLIIDDYGYWKGARKAVEEYFSANNIRILLNRMDDTGRIAVKQVS